MSGILSSASNDDYETIDLSTMSISLQTAEDEFNSAKKTLFATSVWIGCKILSEDLISRENFIKDKSVLEFGSGCGLPSIVCVRLGARVVCSSDYPAPMVIETLRKNIQHNQEHHEAVVAVVPYIWGQDVQELLGVNISNKYDVIIASECLWRHESHTDLLASILSTIAPEGHLFIAYSHHIPGLEEQDDAFITMAIENGLEVKERKEIAACHMWDDQKSNTIILIEFVYNASKDA